MSSMKFVVLVFGLVAATAAAALPVTVTEAEFSAQTQGLQVVVENFDNRPVGPLTSPVTLTNGIFEGDPSILNQFWCFASPCLTVGVVGGRFHSFPAGTTHWSGRVLPASDGNVLELTVTGNSGSQVFTLPPMNFVPGGVFVGFHDPSGLRSVEFRLLGTAFLNFSYDNVTTAASAQGATALSVDALSSTGLAGLVTLLLALGLVARRRMA